MLVLTEKAAEAIATLKASSAEIPDDAGLRIVAPPPGGAEETALELAIVAEPAGEDVVVEAEGQQVYLEPMAATLLDDKVLDAQVEQGDIRFAVLQQPGPDGSAAGL
jgi:Fe-S cluster assembly iron-binding protein IscA